MSAYSPRALAGIWAGEHDVRVAGTDLYSERDGIEQTAVHDSTGLNIPEANASLFL